MCWLSGTPGPATCGVPVFTRILRTVAGESGAPFWARAMACRQATAPVTIGEALEVPEKRCVYQVSSDAPGRYDVSRSTALQARRSGPG